MGRLIDADALIEAIENIKLYNVTPGQPTYDMNRVRADELLETINAQPTAYDVDAVVAEITDRVNHEKDSCIRARKAGNIDASNIHKYARCCLELAIDIAKKGDIPAAVQEEGAV